MVNTTPIHWTVIYLVDSIIQPFAQPGPGDENNENHQLGDTALMYHQILTTDIEINVLYLVRII